MIVHYMATYYSQWAHDNLAPRSQAQWYSFKFCRAVKSGRINGSLEFPWKEKPETINEQNVARARWIFGFFIKHVIEVTSIKNPVLIPVPSKDGLINTGDFRSLAMVKEAIAEHGRWTVAPVLRFTEVLTAAHAGGPRGRGSLKPYLKVVGAIPSGDVILIDDIITTGGSLLDSFDALSAVGRAPSSAIVCGHTVSDSLLNAFGHHQRNIDTSSQPVSF